MIRRIVTNVHEALTRRKDSRIDPAHRPAAAASDGCLKPRGLLLILPGDGCAFRLT